ncbi:MAG: M28 family peptidase [Acidobacteriota bacterium]|nr:M28 family peptidase [Acidobacteriota bacterium]
MTTRRLALILLIASLTSPAAGLAQTGEPPGRDPRMYDLLKAVSAERIGSDIRALVSFGTRHTLSETESETRGIGAARRWIHAEFTLISDACGGCLEVSYQRTVVPGREGSRIPVDTEVVNVLATLRGTGEPNRIVIMSGDIDSRVSDANNFTDDSPGANDNASGMAGAIEAARVLSRHAGSFPATIILAGLSGEEQGLYGGRHMASVALDEGWDLEAVLNNDMIGNIEGVDGVIRNDVFRVFSEPTPVTETEEARRRRRVTGGEVDGVSRQLARYVARMTDLYIPNLEAKMIYRLDRFGRGGHHRPFNDAGFPGVRIMETHENYRRQHQDLRVEDGIEYGDVIEGVNFDYAAKLTGVNVITLAGLAWAPAPPGGVGIAGAVRASAVLSWDAVASDSLAGYRVYWRDTTAPQWEHSRFVGDVTEYTFENLVIDNYLFGVASVGKDGNESVVVFPTARR